MINNLSRNQAEELNVVVRKGKEKKIKAPFKGMLGWVLGFVFPFTRA